MRFKLHDFQKDAVTSLLKKMDSMRHSYENDGSLSAVALTAPTGSGKTVISAAVIEGLFYGNDTYAGDDRAAVLWLSDSPSLNEQTMKRFKDSADLLNDTVLEAVSNEFAKSHSRLQAGHVYFLNRQLLGSGKKLAGSAEGGRSFFDVLQNSIEDPDLHLYLFIDEAHKGLGSSDKDKGTSDSVNKTIYSKVIDGQKGINNPMPCVIGISATPERFNFAMDNRVNRDIKSAVTVAVSDVRASGLIKDSIELRTPKKSANTKHQDLTLACVRLNSASKAWSKYCRENNIPTVVPLMVVQVEDNVSKDTLGALCQQIKKTLPWLDASDCFANVFGEHDDIVTDFAKIPYIRPENVSEHTEVKVLFAKDAVSTGWDCPRAEVIYSRRKRNDSTYIAQLIGRMIRTPLARRITSSEELNTVYCFLPEYDENTVESVVERLREDKIVNEEGTEIKVNSVKVALFDETKKKAETSIDSFGHAKVIDIKPPVSDESSNNDSNDKTKIPTEEDFVVNLDNESDIDTEEITTKTIEEAKEVLERIPKVDVSLLIECFENIISRQVRYDKANVFLNLWNLIDIISADIDPDADLDSCIKTEFYNNVEGEITKHPAAYKRALNEISNTTVTVKKIDPLTGDSFESREEAVANDETRLTVYYKNTVNKFSGASDIIKYYINYRTSELDESNKEAIGRIAAVGECMEIVQGLENWAKDRIKKLLDDYGPQRYAVSEEHKEIWDKIEGNTKSYIERKLNIRTTQVSQNSTFKKYAKHIICDEYGWAYFNLNDIEEKVVATETSRPNNKGWYRNQSNNLNGSLNIAYEIGEVWTNMCPDFIFFEEVSGKIVPTIVDPHGDWLADSVPKLKGYVSYLKDHPDTFVKVLAVTDAKGGTYRYLDLTQPNVQTAIETFTGSCAKELFDNTSLSRPYNVKQN